ncbi:MAG: tRNA lysidine(34) synthetase TilS [Planctomycetes bacterium RBG_16_59_8]|nr:MAG: tRNA lysidine(34) synthetase TilS [Planctomycetes bacterium RBG_16_59_8]
MNIVKKVLLTVQGYDLIRQGETVIVGVSGGADSVALLHLLSEINEQQEQGWKLVVAHLNHGIRGAEADGDETFVRDLAGELGLTFISRKVDVRQVREKEKLTIESAGRKERYRFLNECAEKIGAQKVALAHTADDQAETILHRIIRGAGLRGLKGISPIRKISKDQGIFIVRPLIEAERFEIEQFLSERGFSFRVDSSNNDLALTRNRLRHKLIPMIEQEFNPRFKASLVKLGQTAGSSYLLLREIAREIYENIKMLGREGEVCLSVEEFVKTPAALQTLIIDRAIRKVHGSLPQLNFEHYLEVLSLCADQGFSKVVTLPKGLLAKRESYVLKISRPVAKAPPVKFLAQKIKVPGKTTIEGLNIRVEAEIMSRSNIALQDYIKKKDFTEEIVDLDRVRLPLKVRLKKRGDTFSPLGLNGVCKLKRFFISQKVPREVRDQVPIVVDDGGIVWVVGYRIGNEYRVTDDTKSVLLLKIERV